MKNWNKSLLAPESTLEEAIKVLHSGGNRIAFVTDQDKKLLGTVTDGDIRRALLNHAGMETIVLQIMNKSPKVVKFDDDKRKVIHIMQENNLFHVPVLDKKGVLIGAESVHDMLSKHRIENPVFLMAGGFGKRLRPLTLDKPKPLLPIQDKPILARIVETFVEQGFCNFYISVHYKAEQIQEYFGDGSKWGVSIKYVHEKDPLGTAGSLGLLPSNIPKFPIIVMNGDLLTKVNFKRLLEFHEGQESEATMCLKEYDFKVPYGVVNTDNIRISSIQEKPVHKFFVNAGIYVISQRLVSLIDREVYLDMPTFLQERVQSSDLVSAYPIYEYWLDIGQLDHYKTANDNFVNNFLND